MCPVSNCLLCECVCSGDREYAVEMVTSTLRFGVGVTKEVQVGAVWGMLMRCTDWLRPPKHATQTYARVDRRECSQVARMPSGRRLAHPAQMRIRRIR
jgi:hypothetical protein